MEDSASVLSVLDPKGKGKLVPASAERKFLICSVGDKATERELREEKRIGEFVCQDDEYEARQDGAATGSIIGNKMQKETIQTRRLAAAQVTTTPQPRGFDRLQTTGFTPNEIHQLRLQFTSILGSRHTPDTMPSPDTIRNLEDAWIDNNASTSAYPNGSTADPSSPGFDDANLSSDLLDIFLQGMVAGFFWPVGILCWMGREEGMWSKRRQIAVGFGVVISVAVGVFKTAVGEG